MLRCLSDPALQIANFYGLVCLDCVIGDAAPQFDDPYLVAASDVDAYCLTDSTSEEETTVHNNSVYIPAGRSNTGCYQDTSSSINSLITIDPVEEEIRSLPHDPDIAYYTQFDTVDPQLPVNWDGKYGTNGRSLDNDLETLTKGYEEGLVLRKCLSRVQYHIATVKDVEKKRPLVTEYEFFKAKYDEDNVDDMEKASLYIDHARNTKPYQHTVSERHVYYQKAIAFTNNLDKKKELQAEYRRFHYSVKPK